MFFRGFIMEMYSLESVETYDRLCSEPDARP